MERVRRSMSAAEKVEVWRRCKRGESVSDISRALGRLRKLVHRVVAAHGGVPPRPRTRAPVLIRRATALQRRPPIAAFVAPNSKVANPSQFPHKPTAIDEQHHHTNE